jgi:hypothetical protein
MREERGERRERVIHPLELVTNRSSKSIRVAYHNSSQLFILGDMISFIIFILTPRADQL